MPSAQRRNIHGGKYQRLKELLLVDAGAHCKVRRNRSCYQWINLHFDRNLCIKRKAHSLLGAALSTMTLYIMVLFFLSMYGSGIDYAFYFLIFLDLMDRKHQQ